MIKLCIISISGVRPKTQYFPIDYNNLLWASIRDRLFSNKI